MIQRWKPRDCNPWACSVIRMCWTPGSAPHCGRTPRSAGPALPCPTNRLAHVATETQDSGMPVANVCPHCGTLVPVKQEHMYMRTRKITCPNCKKPFRPGGPWPADDLELPTAKQASERFELGRNFANKLWNAARFLLMNLEGYEPGAIRIEELPIEDRWILSRLATTTAAVTEQLE